MDFKVEKIDSNKVIVTSVNEPKDDGVLRKKLHDVTAAMRTINLCVKSIENGYRFDDDMAPAKLKALRSANDQLTNEIPLLEKVYTAFVE